MIPGTYNLSLYRGDTYEWRVFLWQDLLQTVPVDLAGCTVDAQWRDKAGAATFVDIPLTVTLPNTIDLAITTTVWNQAPNPGVWDLQVTDVDERVMTVLYGTIKVTQDVTVP